MKRERFIKISEPDRKRYINTKKKEGCKTDKKGKDRIVENNTQQKRRKKKKEIIIDVMVQNTNKIQI